MLYSGFLQIKKRPTPQECVFPVCLCRQSIMPIAASELEPTKLPPGVKLSDLIKTVPHDARNPNANQVNDPCTGFDNLEG